MSLYTAIPPGWYYIYILAASLPYNLQNGPKGPQFPPVSGFILQKVKFAWTPKNAESLQCHPASGQRMILKKKKIILSVFCCWSFADVIINSLWQGNTEGILRPSLVSICTHCNQFLCEPILIICYEFKYMSRWFVQSTLVQASKCSQFVCEPLDQTFCAFWEPELERPCQDWAVQGNVYTWSGDAGVCVSVTEYHFCSRQVLPLRPLLVIHLPVSWEP